MATPNSDTFTADIIALYVRVSTDEQVQHGFSIDNQKERLAAYCTSQGWADYRFYIDDGYTGTNTDRPALQRMIRHIQEGKIKTVLVYRLDRLGRKQKDVLHLLEDVFDKNGVPFKSATEPFDTSTPLGKAMLGILAVFAQLERDTIVERVTSGRRQRIRRGKWYGGREPFGYHWNKETTTLEIVPEEAALVREVYKRYLQGQSMSAIADWVAERSKARKWSHVPIRDMLERPIYTGHLNLIGDLVEGNHEVIIDMDTWQMVQSERQRRIADLTPVGKYLLTGLLRCGVCGGTVVHLQLSQRGKYKYEYYACQRQHVRRREGGTGCSLGYKKVFEVDAWVVERLKQLALNPLEVTAELADNQDSRSTNEQLILDLQKQLQDVEVKLERWYTAFEEGELQPAKVRARTDALEEEKKALLLRLEELDDTPKVDRSGVIADTIHTIGQDWDYMTLDEQQAVLRLAISKVVLHKNADPEFIWNI